MWILKMRSFSKTAIYPFKEVPQGIAQTRATLAGSNRQNRVPYFPRARRGGCTALPNPDNG